MDHHRKAAYLGAALVQAGFDLVNPDDDYDFDVCLVDTDHPQAAPAPYKHAFVLEARKRGVQIGLYPHGGLPVLDYDGMRQPLLIAFELVHGVGHKLCYEAARLKRRVEVVGWSYTDIVAGSVGSPGPLTSGASGRALTPDEGKPETPQGVAWSHPSPGITGDLGGPLSERHLLFAPIHPWADGKSILDFHRDLNEIAYRVFLDHPAPRKTVRQYGEDEPNGIVERREGIDYQQSDLTLGVDLIDSADAVISYGTFACTALARGKPVAMIHPYPPFMSDDGTKEAVHFADYAAMTRYPASICDGPLDELFATDTSEWEQKFIGGPLDIDHVADVIRQYKMNRKQRRIKARM